MYITHVGTTIYIRRCANAIDKQRSFQKIYKFDAVGRNSYSIKQSSSLNSEVIVLNYALVGSSQYLKVQFYIYI